MTVWRSATSEKAEWGDKTVPLLGFQGGVGSNPEMNKYYYLLRRMDPSKSLRPARPIRDIPKVALRV